MVGFCSSCGAPACERHPAEVETWNDVLDNLRQATPESQPILSPELVME